MTYRIDVFEQKPEGWAFEIWDENSCVFKTEPDEATVDKNRAIDKAVAIARIQKGFSAFVIRLR